ncbi:MAG: hypothetical protein WA110_06200 [Anaerolineaceae bacterium]
MENKTNDKFLKIFTLAAFLVMVTVNALANILPINGITTGEVSNAYPNLFAPAGLIFSIWGLIYLLLAGYSLYQIGLFQEKDESDKPDLLHKVSLVFAISSLANTAWIFTWHYRLIPLSMLLMVVILGCLITINLAIRKENLSTREKIFVRLPFSVYFGWITVATIANATTLLVSLDWNGFGVSETTWTIIILAVGMLIGTVTTIKNRDSAYGFVLVWAYAGILIKHTSTTGFAGQYPAVITTTIVCIVLLLAASIYAFASKRQAVVTTI